MHHDHDTYNPGADWREEAGAWDTATAALGRFGSDWAKGAGRTYRWKDHAVTLYDPSGEVARITRTARAEVDLVIRDGIARRHPTAQNAIIHARVMLGMTPQEDTVTRTEIGPASAQLLTNLSAHLCGIFGNLTPRVTATALTLIRNGTPVFRLEWDGAGGAEVWRVSDRLTNPSYDAAVKGLEDLVADTKRRYPVPVPVVPVITGTDEDVEDLAAFGAELLRHNGGLRCGVSAVTLKGAALRVESEAACHMELVLADDGTWAARWRDDEEDFEELTDAMAWLRAQTSWGTDPPSANLCELATDVSELCEELVALLDRKNKAYGDSARKPLAVFSQLPAIARLAVRIDDKLSRIARGSEDAKAAVPEDTVLDLIGYLAIYLVETRKADR